MRKPRRGELRSQYVSQEVGVIWRSRHEEPEEEEPIYMRCAFETSPADEDIQDFARHTWALLERLPPSRARVLTLRYLHDMRYWEIGEMLGVTVERVRQIEMQALRILRSPKFVGTLGGCPFQGHSKARHPGFAWENPL